MQIIICNCNAKWWTLHVSNSTGTTLAGADNSNYMQISQKTLFVLHASLGLGVCSAAVLCVHAC